MAERSAADRLGTVTLPEHLYPSTSFRQRKNKTRTTLGFFVLTKSPLPVTHLPQQCHASSSLPNSSSHLTHTSHQHFRVKITLCCGEADLPPRCHQATRPRRVALGRPAGEGDQNQSQQRPRSHRACQTLCGTYVVLWQVLLVVNFCFVR